MMSLISKLRKSRKGAAAVEFAMVLPPFLLLVFGIIEYGRLFWTTSALNDTAISTARCMGIPQNECTNGNVYTPADTQKFAIAKAAGWYITLNSSDITLDRNATCNSVPGFSSVTVHYTFETVIPQVIMSLAGGTKLSSTACYPNLN